MQTRREFISAIAASGLIAGTASRLPGTFASSGSAENADVWSEVPRILSRIRPPIFPQRDFDIRKFGGAGDNRTDCTEAFAAAIKACNQAGGGRVVVPAGEYSTGPIHLLSRVNLHVSSGATIRFFRDPRKYPNVFTRWEGIELMNYSPFIYAFEQQDIAITGRGTIDGNSDCEHWWPWKGRTECGWKAGDVNQDADRTRLFEMAEKNVPVPERVFGLGHYLRPMFIQPYRCKNVLIEGVRLTNSPMWQVHPVLCTNVCIRDLIIQGPSLGPNTDGCDPESCKDLLIRNCMFDTGDDCIAINSGRNADGRRLNVPAENIVIQNCRMRGGHGGVTVGSQISGGVKNVFAENCQMDSPHLDIAIRIKNNAMRGGLLDGIHVRNITVGQVAQAALAIDFLYEEGEKGNFTPVVRNVSIQNLKTQRTEHALYLRGLKNAPIDGVTLDHCDFGGVAKPSVLENVRSVTVRNVRINGRQVKTIE